MMGQVRDNLRWWFLERLTRGQEQEVHFGLPELHGEILQTTLLALPDLAHLHLDVSPPLRRNSLHRCHQCPSDLPMKLARRGCALAPLRQWSNLATAP